MVLRNHWREHAPLTGRSPSDAGDRANARSTPWAAVIERYRRYLRLMDPTPHVWSDARGRGSHEAIRTTDPRHQNWSHRHGHSDISRTLVNADRGREQRYGDPAVSGDHPREAARRASPQDRGHALAHEGARCGSVAGRAAGDAQSTRSLLGDGLRLAEGRSQAERTAAVRDEDRWRGHSLHPRQIAA